jgi:hypothetical protein
MPETPIPPVVIADPHPIPPDALAAAWLGRRFRLLPATANTVRELAGFGLKEGARR